MGRPQRCQLARFANSDAKRTPSASPLLQGRLSPKAAHVLDLKSETPVALGVSGDEGPSVGIPAGRKLSAVVCLPAVIGLRTTVAYDVPTKPFLPACEAVLKRGRPIKHPIKATGFECGHLSSI
jgi:hypothetical protein